VAPAAVVLVDGVKAVAQAVAKVAAPVVRMGLVGLVGLVTEAATVPAAPSRRGLIVRRPSSTLPVGDRLCILCGAGVGAFDRPDACTTLRRERMWFLPPEGL
jgi:hypothetical protein